MGGLFSMDGKVAVFLGKIADMVILNFLLVICSIPVITAGASATAFCHVMLKLVRDEESYVVRSFFQIFRESFKQSTIVYLIMLAVAGVLCCDFFLSMQMAGGTGSPLFIVFCVLAVFFYMGSCYIFPILGFFENSTKKVFKNAFLMAIAHFPYTLLIAVVALIPWFILFFGMLIPATFFDLFFGFSISGWINAKIFIKIFKKYIPE